MKIKPKAIIGFLGTTFFIMFLMWGWGYISAVNSDMYKFSEEYVKNSPKIVEEFGTVGSVSLDLLNFKRKFSNGTWKGSFELAISGSKSKGKIRISLQSFESGWQVLSEEVLFKN